MPRSTVLLESWNIYAIRDDNSDGYLDAGELSDATLDETDAVTGAYSFSLAPGRYFICEETGGSTWTQSSPLSGDADYTAECDDQNATFDPDLATGGYYVTVTSQSTDIEQRLRQLALATKSGSKFEDQDADGSHGGRSTVLARVLERSTPSATTTVTPSSMPASCRDATSLRRPMR